MDWRQKQLGGLPEAKPTLHTGKSQDHKQLIPEPLGMPQKMLLEIQFPRMGLLCIPHSWEFLRARLKHKPFSQGLRNPEQEDVC